MVNPCCCGAPLINCGATCGGYYFLPGASITDGNGTYFPLRTETVGSTWTAGVAGPGSPIHGASNQPAGSGTTYSSSSPGVCTTTSGYDYSIGFGCSGGVWNTGYGYGYLICPDCTTVGPAGYASTGSLFFTGATQSGTVASVTVVGSNLVVVGNYSGFTLCPGQANQTAMSAPTATATLTIPLETPANQTCCSPCSIPNKNLTLTIGATVTTLTYNSVTSVWTDGTHTLRCSASFLSFTGGGTWTLDQPSKVCQPLHLKYTSGATIAFIDE